MSHTPKPYDRVHIFGSASSNNPGNPVQGTDLDAEFNAVETALDETQARLALIQRDDGELANASVGPDQLTQDAIDMIDQSASDAAQEVIDAGLIEIGLLRDDAEGSAADAAASAAQAQTSANASGSSAAASAASAVDSSNSADDSEAEAIDSAASADLARYYYEQLDGALAALAPRTVLFNGTGAQVSFQLPTSISDEEFLDVFINGLAIRPDLYSVTGSTLTFTTAPAAGTENVMVKIASSVQIMPIVTEDWGLITESVDATEDWGSIAN